MILVKGKLRNSDIHGIGFFSTEFIPKGTMVWRFEPGFDMVLTPKQVESLSEAAREQFLNYAYISKATGNYILCTDDSRFFNHSYDANIKCERREDPASKEAMVCYAIRDIPPGEEMTDNYSDFDDEPLTEVLKR